jgi:speckle-type POZ protein
LPEIDEDDKIPMLQHLLVAADRYDIQRLKLICENKLCISVNANVAVTTLMLAEQHGYRRLKEACIKLLKVHGNFKALGYDDYSYLKQWCPSLLDDLPVIYVMCKGKKVRTCPYFCWIPISIYNLFLFFYSRRLS